MSKDRKKHLHANHRARMRKRFEGSGFDDYHPHEVLEQTLFEAIPRVNTNETAHMMLDEFGSLENVLCASAQELTKIHGIGNAAASYLSVQLDRVSELILEQYKGVSDLNEYQIAFLTDWFMRHEDGRNFGLIVCDKENKFVDFTFLLSRAECELVALADSNDLLQMLVCRISEKVSDGSYYFIMKDFLIDRADLYCILDETRKNGAVMLNAYKIVGKRPVSAIYPN